MDWLSHKAYADAGVDVPSNWDEFVAAAPALEAAGKIPLAMGQQPWQSSGAFGVMAIAIAGIDAWTAVNVDKDAAVAGGADYARVFEAAANARTFAANSNVQDWNQATNLVITGQAGGQIMGDWAQGEFAVAEQTAGVDYTCLPGLGVNEIISTGGDAFYFPKQNDADIEAAQKELAALLLSPEVQVSFNLKKARCQCVATSICLQRMTVCRRVSRSWPPAPSSQVAIRRCLRTPQVRSKT